MRRYYFLILAALLLFFGMESEAQVDSRFAMAASFSNVSVVDDSTYTADLSFQSDQLGQGYLANQVQVGWRVITSTRREYRISAVNSSSFSTANLTLVELPGTNASPNGVATVYQYDGSTRIIPTLPVNSTGISSAKLATLLIHNFEQIAAGGGGGTTNLAYTASPTQGVVTSSTGTDATIPATDSTNAGLFLPAEKTKLTGIETGATADMTPAEIEAAYNSVVPEPTTQDILNGDSRDTHRWSVEAIADMARRWGDSTRVLQDSILVYYRGGVEVGRDTLAVGGAAVDLSFDNTGTKLTATEAPEGVRELALREADLPSNIIGGSYTMGTLITVRGNAVVGDEGKGARYLVQASAPVGYPIDSIAVIPLSSGYAVLQSDKSEYNILWFDRSGGTDLADAIYRAMDYAPAGSKLTYPPGTWSVNRTIKMDNKLHHTGQNGTGLYGQTTLQFPADSVGFVFTYPLNSDYSEGKDSRGSILSHMRIRGNLGVDTTAHGIFIIGNARLDGVAITNFAGNGVHVGASTTVPVGLQGNANNWYFEDVKVGNCHHGFFIDGADSNAGTAISCDAAVNRRWGIYDSSFLGNTWVGAHTATNGTECQVSHNGVRYAALQTNSNVEPGVDAGWENVWYQGSLGGVNAVIFPAWDSLTTYYEGGGYKTDNPNARTVFVGCYSESDQLLSDINNPSYTVNGLMASYNKGTGLRITPDGAGRFNFPVFGSQGGASMVFGNNANNLNSGLLSFESPAGTIRLKYNTDPTFGKNNFAADYQNGSFKKWYIISGDNTNTFGRSAVPTTSFGKFWFPSFFIGDISGHTSTREISVAKAGSSPSFILPGNACSDCGDGDLKFITNPQIGGYTMFVADRETSQWLEVGQLGYRKFNGAPSGTPVQDREMVRDTASGAWYMYDGSAWINIMDSGTDNQAAADVNATDAGGYFSGTELESITQELGADVAALQSAEITTGTASGTTDVSGDLVVTHGMGTTPTSIVLTPQGTSFLHLQYHTVGATTFTVRVLDATGAAVTSGAVSLSWHAK